jgi:hypothetical protein
MHWLGGSLTSWVNESVGRRDAYGVVVKVNATNTGRLRKLLKTIGWLDSTPTGAGGSAFER